jgi:two-component system, NtrC family, response regulator AtoC
MIISPQPPSVHPLHVLIAEDEPELRGYLQLALRRPNLVIDFVENGAEALRYLAQRAEKPALVILDVVMPHKDGITTLREIRRTHAELPIIMLSGATSACTIVEAMQSGANNVLTKPVSHDVLHQAVDQALPGTFGSGAGGQPLDLSPAGNWVKTVEPLLRRISTSDVPVLLLGETGSGKEVLARRIHAESMRADEIFLKLNCAALPSELVESELFGYERGSFTGAFKSNPGKFELANRGTILLDEIGDMDLKLQAKLLQVLQDQEFLRLGAKEPTRVDVRVIAATHRNLEERVAEGAFREDLYYRLKVVNIFIPPLRERKNEVIPLAQTFLEKHNRSGSEPPRIGAELTATLLNHRWPGNVRELENIMRSYLVVRDPTIVINELNETAMRAKRRALEAAVGHNGNAHSVPAALDGSQDLYDENGPAQPVRMQPPSQQADFSRTELAKVDEARRKAETELILRTLNGTLWNRKRAAATLGIDYRALLYKMKKLGIVQPAQLTGAA